MAEFITVCIDLGLGLLAYRLAYENRRRITAIEDKVELVFSVLRKAGLLDDDSN